MRCKYNKIQKAYQVYINFIIFTPKILIDFIMIDKEEQLQEEQLQDNLQEEKANKNKIRIRKFLLWFWGIIAFFIFSVVFLFFLIAEGYLGVMPSFEELENPKNSLATQIYSSDHKVLGTFAYENRTYVDYEELSPYLVKALISTEDLRFYDHSGIDSRALMRIIVRTVIMRNKNSGGGSTISQQLAKLLFHDPAKNIWQRILQKLNEWVIAVKLERSYTKNEILTMYLNKVGFIYDAYGIQSATHTFFNSDCKDVKIQEAATIIGMLKNPALFNPVRRPDTTLFRRNVVLNQMLKANFIDREEYDSLKLLPLGLDFNRRDHKKGVAPYFREHIRLTLMAPKPVKEKYPSYLESKYKADSLEWETNPIYGFFNKNLKSDGSKYNIYRDGLKIYTTVNYDMQVYAENAVRNHLGGYLQEKFNEEKKDRTRAPFTNNISEKDYKRIIRRAIHNSNRYREMRKAGISRDSIYATFDIPVKMSVFSWNGNIDTTMTPRDSIIYFKKFLRAALYSVNPHNGNVKAYVGGPNFKYFMYDMATVGRRQVGSTIKPFLYTLAMQEGHTPCELVPNIPQTFVLPNGKTWTPRESSKNKIGEMVSLKWGIANSNNNITAWVMKQYNPKTVRKMIHDLGIKSPMDAVPSLCLGIPDFTLQEMTNAYATYANKGVRIEPVIITRIEDKMGNIIANITPKKKEVISEKTAYLMLDILQGVVNIGTGKRLRYKYKFTGQIGGKTGTSQHHSDGWFIGVTPKLVTGVWVGGEDRDIHFDGIRLGQGASMALPIWAIYMKQVYNDSTNLNIYESDEFVKPLNFDVDVNCESKVSNSKEEEIEDTFIDESEFE